MGKRKLKRTEKSHAFSFKILNNIKAFIINFVMVFASFQSLYAMEVMIYRNNYVLAIILAFDYILRKLFQISYLLERKTKMCL
jgi:hypothetical protein